MTITKKIKMTIKGQAVEDYDALVGQFIIEEIKCKKISPDTAPQVLLAALLATCDAFIEDHPEDCKNCKAFKHVKGIRKAISPFIIGGYAS